MNAPITVSVPYRHNALQTLEMLIAAGIPATPQITKGKVRIVSTKGDLVVTNKKTWVRGQPFIFQWNPPAPGDADPAALHRKLAAETLRADEGWRRYEAANKARNAAEAELARRPLFQANDAHRFVIVASMLSAAYYAARIEITDPVHLALHRIVAEEPPTVPAPEYWRKAIDRAVTEAGGAK